jgi:hypothetical protein
MHNLLRTLLFALTVFPGLGLAAESDESIFSFDAFGTLGVVYSDEDQADFSGSSLKPDGAGHSRRWTADVDTLIGGQLTANFTERLSAVIQVISELTPDGDYAPHVEWANLQYHVTPELSIRIGRSVLPSFYVSTYRKIGYANHWVRPPIELYDLVPITSRDGISANYTIFRGNMMNSLELTYGQTQTDIVKGYTLEAREGWSISDTFESGDLTIHASYQGATLNLDTYDALFAGFRSFGAAGDNIASRYNPNDKNLTYVGLGVSYDPGRWFVIGEWGQTRSDRSILGDRSAAYVSGGHRFGTLTPYVTLARTRHEAFPAEPGLDLSALPPSQATAAGSLNNALLSSLTAIPRQNSLSVGARWEVNRQMAFIAQFDHSNILNGSSGFLTNLQPGFRRGGSLNLFSASLNFVFP